MDGFDNNGYETVETVETVDTNNGYDSTYSQPQPEEGGSKVFGIISLVCGILALLCSCCGWVGIVFAVAAIVLGIISINKQEDAKGMAIAGIVCGGIGLIIGIVIVIMGAALSSMDPDSVEQFVEQLEESI